VFEQTDKVVATLEAKFNDGQFDPTIRSVAVMETVVADAGAAGLKIFCDEVSAVSTVNDLLTRVTAEAKTRPKGMISFCLMADGLPGEVDIDVNKPFHITPEIKGAIKSLDGVVMVEDY
jgi:DNA polymerase-3 subunit alpha